MYYVWNCHLWFWSHVYVKNQQPYYYLPHLSFLGQQKSKILQIPKRVSIFLKKNSYFLSSGHILPSFVAQNDIDLTMLRCEKKHAVKCWMYFQYISLPPHIHSVKIFFLVIKMKKAKKKMSKQFLCSTRKRSVSHLTFVYIYMYRL